VRLSKLKKKYKALKTQQQQLQLQLLEEKEARIKLALQLATFQTGTSVAFPTTAEVCVHRVAIGD
jgi:hypothetical protein